MQKTQSFFNSCDSSSSEILPRPWRPDQPVSFLGEHEARGETKQRTDLSWLCMRSVKPTIRKALAMGLS